MVRELLVTNFVPLERSPLGDVLGVMVRGAPASRFEEGAATTRVEVPITDYVRAVVADTAIGPRPGPHLALTSAAEGDLFGVATFGSRPVLRLVLTVATELQLR
jgi:hypothetical protein